MQASSWEWLQEFLQGFASLRPGPVARSAMHHVLTKAGQSSAATGIWGVDRALMCQAVGIPAHVTGLPPELEVFLEQAVAVVRAGSRPDACMPTLIESDISGAQQANMT